MPRKLTTVPPPAPAADADAKAAAPAAARPRKKPAKPAEPSPISIAPRPRAAPVAGTPRRPPGTPGPKPGPTGVRAAKAVVRPLTSIAPAQTGLAPLTTPSGARLHPVGALPPARIPPEALHPPHQPNILAWAAGISVAIHAVILTIHFAPPDIKRLFDRGPPLEIALVNAKTKEKPQKAEILAQANLDGGGNTDADRRAKTPLPVLPKDSSREDIALATERVQTLERQTQELLTQLRGAPTLSVQPRPVDQAQPTESPTANELMQRTLDAMRLEAQIAKDLDTYAKRPKRHFVGSRAEEYRFARYVEDWRLKVERIGNLNYPEAARKQKLYGSLQLTVSIRADGSVEDIVVNKTSGKRVLDAAAVHIVQMAAPYAIFPPDVRRDTDILHITRTWTFTKADELISK